MNAFQYKGYVGTFEFEHGDDAFHGEIAGIRDVIHFTGRSVDELRQAFREAVETMCPLARRSVKALKNPTLVASWSEYRQKSIGCLRLLLRQRERV